MNAKTVLLMPGVILVGTLLANPAAKQTNAPRTSAVVFENEKVRCIEYQAHGGKEVCGLGMHSHPAHLYIQLTPGKLRITTPDGKEEVVDAKAGEVGWEPAVTHRVECISGEETRVYLVEIKDKDWKPSTGLAL